MRISWIDNLRWFWILLIVLGHCILPANNLLTPYIFSFHVALFFFLSWFLFNSNKYLSFKKYFKNRFSRLIIPFVFFNIIYFVFYKLIWEFSWTRIIDFLVWLFYWDYLWDNWWYFNNTGWFNLVNVATWFLPALFITSIYYFFINKFIKSKIYKFIILLLLSIIIFIESKITIFRLPWSMEIWLVAVFFYWTAHIFKEQILYFVEKINLKYLLLLPIVLTIHLNFLNSVNISTNYYWNNYILFLLNTFLWILFFTIISKNIWKNKLLDFYWKNSIIVLWFEWIKQLIYKKIDIFSFWLIPKENLWLSWFYEFFLTLIFLIPIIFIINKYLRFILWEFNWKFFNR